METRSARSRAPHPAEPHPPTRRRVLGWLPALMALAALGSPDRVRAAPPDAVTVSARIRVLRLPDGTLGARLFPDGFDTALAGRLEGPAVDLEMPMPGILPTYRIAGTADGSRVTLRVDRGPLSPRLLTARRPAPGEPWQVGIHAVDRHWSPRRLTNAGLAVVAPGPSWLTLVPQKDEPRYRRYELRGRLDGARVSGGLEGVRHGDDGEHRDLLATVDGRFGD